MDKEKIFRVSSILQKKDSHIPMRTQLSGRILQKTHKDRLRKNRKIHLQKLKLQISQHLIKQYVKDMNYQSNNYISAKEINSIDKVKNYWEQKVISPMKNKQKCQKQGLKISNRKLFPSVKQSKISIDKKSKAKFNQSSMLLRQSQIISGAKKILDSRQIKHRKYGQSQGIVRSVQLVNKAKINGSRIFQGKLGPWKSHQEVILDFYN